jgi:hypothetical protein
MLATAASAYKLKQPGSAGDRLFAICPHSMPDLMVKDVEKRAEDFRCGRDGAMMACPPTFVSLELFGRDGAG